MEYPFLPKIVEEVSKDYPQLAKDEFECGLTEFFEASDPDYDAVKWNLAQNYYVSVALGLDGTNTLLSKEMFDNSTFYVDTNIAIAALEPSHPLHAGFLSLLKTCADLHITLRVCRVSIDELNNWLINQREMFRSGALQQISQSVGTHVDSLVYGVYAKKKSPETEVDEEQLFESFQAVEQDLSTKFGIHVDDDEWFDNARNLPNVKRLTSEIRASGTGRPGREKSYATALHDSTMMYWIHQIRTTSRQTKVWMLTADLTLPRSVSESNKPVTITLDALLQWLSPIVNQPNALRSVFAEMIKSKILPQERFFKAGDFRVFAMLQMQCRDLPDKDVTDCIRYIAHNAPDLDPNKAEDREKLALYVQRFFSDPSREYTKNLAHYEEALGQADVEKQDIEIRYRKMLEEQNEEHIKAIQAKDEKLSTSEQENKALRILISQRQEDEKRRQQSQRKWIRVTLGFISLMIILFSLTAAFGSGENMWQKIAGSYDILALLSGLYVLLSGAYLTRFDKILMRRVFGFRDAD